MRQKPNYTVKNHLLNIGDHSKEEILSILKLIGMLKRAHYQGVQVHLLKDKVVGLMFTRASLRTRVSFETAATLLGGHAEYISEGTLHVGKGNESMRDTAEVLSRMVDCVVIRSNSSDEVDDFAKYAFCPVIDGCTVDRHPTQVICDVFTMMEHRPDLKFEEMKVMFISDCNQELHHVCSVQRSMMAICAILGMTFIACAPKIMQPCENDVKMFERLANNTGAKMLITEEPDDYIAEADFLVSEIVTRKGSGWRSGLSDDEFNEMRLKLLLPKYQVNAELLKKAKPNVGVMHCMPGKRDEEITSEVWDGPNSLLFEEAENRLHTQKALLAWFVRPAERSRAVQEYHMGCIEDFLLECETKGVL